MVVGGQHHAPAALSPEKDPVPIVQEAGWAPGPVWTGAENLAPYIGIRSPDRPARSESLYRLSYPGPLSILHTAIKSKTSTYYSCNNLTILHVLKFVIYGLFSIITYLYILTYYFFWIL